MFNSLSSNTGESSVKKNQEAQIKNVYECINDLEERINANCACGNCLQEQIDNINDATTIVKDEGQFNNVYTDTLNVTNPIIAPGVDNSFTVAGDLSANDISATNACLSGNLTVDGNTVLNGPTSFGCVTCLEADNATVDCLTAPSMSSTAISTDTLTACNSVSSCSTITNACVSNAYIDTASLNTATVSCGITVASDATLCALGSTKICSEKVKCSDVDDAKIWRLVNSRQIGSDFISVPIDEESDFYRYQIYPGFSGEVNLWNCDYSINILTNNSNNVLVGYRTEDPAKIKGFYKDNVNNRFYVEVRSTEPICWSYRSAQHCCYDFSQNNLIEACTDAGAYYSTDCVYVCVCDRNYKDHWYLMGDNTTKGGMSVCGGLSATYLEFQCAYFPGGLILDSLCVNGPSYLNGDVTVGTTCDTAQLKVCTLIDTNNLNVHCTTCLGDRLAPQTNYVLSLEWIEDEEYYTYDAVTETYTYVGAIDFDDWVPNTYYWKEILDGSVVNVIATQRYTGDQTVQGNITQSEGNITQCCGCYKNIDSANGTATTINSDITVISNSDGCSYTVGNSSATFTDGTQSSTTTRKDITFTNPVSKSKMSASGIAVQSGNHQNVISPSYIKIEDSNSHTIISADGIEAPSQVISGDLTVCGDIYQCGTSYETHAEQLYTTKDCICLRDGAQAGLSAGCYSGIEVIKYDGTNNTAITTDNTGTWCVGTSNGAMQPLATRSDELNMIDGAIVQWCAACNCLYTAPALCDCSNVVYYDAANKKLYTGSVGMVDACPIYWCDACKCFVTGPSCHETFLCGLGPIVLGTCEVEDPVTHECTMFCTIDAPAMVTAWTMDPLGINPAVQDCCVKIVNITRECYDALAVKDACSYYMICDEWSGGLSLNNFCAGDNVTLERCDGDLYISATASGVLSGIYGGNYVSVCPRSGGGITIDACAIDVSCYCAGNGITLACGGTAGDELTIGSKVCTLTQDCYDNATKIADYLYFTTDTCKIYYGSCVFSKSEPIGTVKMCYASTISDPDWLPMDGSPIPAGYDALCAYLGVTTMPDMREFSPVMIGCNTGFAEGTLHDCYTLAQCKMDQVGTHKHNVGNTLDVTSGTLGFTTSASNPPRIEAPASQNTTACSTYKCIINCTNYWNGSCTLCMNVCNATSGYTICGSPSLTGSIAVCNNASSNVNRGRRFGLLFLMKAR